MKKNIILNKRNYKKYGMLIIAMIVVSFAIYNLKIQSVDQYKSQQQSMLAGNGLLESNQSENGLSQSKGDADNSTDNKLGVSSEILEGGTNVDLAGNGIGNTSNIASNNANSIDKDSNNGLSINNDLSSVRENNDNNTENISISSGNQIGDNKDSSTANANNNVTCTIEIRCDTLSNNLNKWTNQNSDPSRIVPQNGVILSRTSVTLKGGSSAYDVLKYVALSNNISIQVKATIYGTYIVGIQQINEKDAGSLSGWIYKVNGNTVSYGISEYKVVNGDEIKLLYTCNMGLDLQ